MIAKYLYTIGKYLSAAQRDEVLKDIEVNLYDYLEENFGQQTYTDSQIETAIRAMGHPRKVAEAYMNEPRVLIGPALIDTYWLVVKIAVIAIALGLTIANFIGLSGSEDAVKMMIQLATEIWNASLSALGMITLIFAGIQHTSPTEKIEKEAWSLKILEEVAADQDRIKVFDLIIETFFMGLGFVALNQWIPLGNGTEVISTHLMQNGFMPYLIGFNSLIILGVLLNGYLLITQQWKKQVRLLAIVLDVIGVFLFTHLTLNQGLWQFSLVGINTALDTVIRLSINIGLAVLVIIVAFDVIGHVKALIRNK